MTDRQIQLLHSEVQRHVSLAMSSREPAIHRGHMEVAEALSAAIQEHKEETKEESLCEHHISPLSARRRIVTSVRGKAATAEGSFRGIIGHFLTCLDVARDYRISMAAWSRKMQRFGLRCLARRRM